ncbi:hypothetical protein KIN20_003688 [Parelaphostrongylus tenuis]|uniref:Uncharacterized protein n=1 Tax=Parelaphostrongylus tenuis TaxID=148309 RepID=A0AAD5LX92_PARTN|nr:hypothetical protein KIN20_003688 [Parelaphostrongylus tenuis]
MRNPDVAEGVYTKEAEEADREADDFVVDRAEARAEEEYDRAAAVKVSGSEEGVFAETSAIYPGRFTGCQQGHSID